MKGTTNEQDKTHEDCFAYHEETKRCTALKALYCRKEQCSFYKKNKKEGV